MRTLATRFGPCRVLARKREAGAPKALLIHGSGGRAEIWSPVMDIFREIDPLAIEMPGHGESPLPFLRSLEDHVLLVEDIRSVLGVDQCIVVGHSLGGAVALQYARDFPSRCGAIVAVSSGPDFIVDLTRVAKLETEWEASIEHFARGQVSPNANSDMLDRARQLIRTRRPATLAHDLRVCTMFSAHNWLGRLQVPTLVVCAYEDSLTPFEGSRSLASRIPGAALSVISPGGHSLMLEHPIRFARAIDAFVEHLRVGEP